jgi:Alr-MurF fusion protein
MIELEALVEATGGRVEGAAGARSFSDWCYDSRLARPGEIFVAIRTERRDGHQFIADALAAGCTGVLCERPPADAGGATVVVVEDTLAALGRWASVTLRRYAPRVVAVTGSVGKSSTKRAIATLLVGQGPVFRSRRSFNSLFGLPLALGTLAPEHRFAVLEMGVDRFGEMAQLAALFPPHVAVVTNVAPTHLRYLRDEEHIAAEKGALVAALPPDGCAVLNADDRRVRAMAARTGARILWYGMGDDLPPDALRATGIETDLHGTHFMVHWHGEQRRCTLPFVGRHSAYIALAAIGAALACGVGLDEAVARCASLEPQNGRLRPLPGRDRSTILDDTYNASPRSTLAALEALRDMPARRRVAVLGDMLELGEQAPALHRALGATAGAVTDLVVTQGDLAAEIALGVREAHPNAPTPVVTHTTQDAANAARAALGPGDVVLVKGSAGARMEAVVAALLDPSVDPRAVLVRQETSFEVVRVGAPDRPTWLEIDLLAIGDNAARIKEIVGPRVAVMAVLKADAYGHGAVRVARTVLRRGVSSLGVATVGEAVALRDAGIAAPILVLGYTPPWQVRDAVRRDIQLTIWDDDGAQECTSAARDLDLMVRVHVKVDTGMARLGTHPDAALGFLHRLHALPGVEVVGLFTHLATADIPDSAQAHQQLALFRALVEAAEREGVRPPVVHAANSAATFQFGRSHWDMVRAGIALYGLDPSSNVPCPPGFRSALSFKTAVAQIKTLPPGSPVSYGATFVTERTTRLATIPVGYADGFRRAPAWRCVLVRGEHAPVIGRICMDYAMLDVTHIPGVAVGDEVVLIGEQGDQRITADDVAHWLGTINYEVIAAILPRVPRVV